MARSGTKDFSITRNDIINAALRKIGEWDSGESPSGPEVADAAQALNLLVKQFTAAGAEIWLQKEITLFLQDGQKSYLLGPTGDNVTESYVETALTDGEPGTETSIVVDSITGILDGDYIGIMQDDDSIHWDTVNGTPAGSTVTITNGLASVAAAGNKVYAYTTKAFRPAKLIFCNTRDNNDYDTQVDLIGEIEYRTLSLKGSSGRPDQVWYQPTLDNGTLYVWPVVPGSTVNKLIISAQYYPDDFDVASNNPDFPIEWGNALIWGLANELAPEYQVDLRQQSAIAQRAVNHLNEALDFDVENASIILGAELRP